MTAASTADGLDAETKDKARFGTVIRSDRIR